MTRERKLLDLAHEAPCMLNLSQTCGRYPSVPAHSDMLKHGRGIGHKSKAIFAVSACPDCHALFTRANLGRDGYESVWREAHERYLAYLDDNELICAAKKK